MPAYNELQKAAAARRVKALFRAMDTDVLLRDQFVTDPSQVISEYVSSARLQPQSAIELNRIIYSIMANRPLLEWLHSYAVQQTAELPTVNRFLQEFSRAVAKHNGYHFILSLFQRSVETENVLNHDNLETIIPVMLRIAQLTFGRAEDGDDGTGTGITSLTISQTSWDFNTALTPVISDYLTVSLTALSEFATEMVEAGILDRIGE